MGNLGSAFKVGKQHYYKKIDDKYDELIKGYFQWLKKPINDTCRPNRYRDCEQRVSYYEIYHQHGGNRRLIELALRDRAITIVQNVIHGEKVATGYFVFMFGALIKVIEYVVTLFFTTLFPGLSIIIEIMMTSLGRAVVDKLNADVLASLYSQADLSKLPMFPRFQHQMKELIEYLKKNNMDLILFSS